MSVFTHRLGAAAAALVLVAAPLVAQAATTMTGAEVLAKYNKDGDQTIELPEALMLAADTYKAINPDGDKTLEPNETEGRLTAKDWERANKDGDKTLELDEWLSIARKRFKGADADKDGKLTAAELDSKRGQLFVAMIAH